MASNRLLHLPQQGRKAYSVGRNALRLTALKWENRMGGCCNKTDKPLTL